MSSARAMDSAPAFFWTKLTDTQPSTFAGYERVTNFHPHCDRSPRVQHPWLCCRRFQTWYPVHCVRSDCRRLQSQQGCLKLALPSAAESVYWWRGPMLRWAGITDVAELVGVTIWAAKSPASRDASAVIVANAFASAVASMAVKSTACVGVASSVGFARSWCAALVWAGAASLSIGSVHRQ